MELKQVCGICRGNINGRPVHWSDQAVFIEVYPCPNCSSASTTKSICKQNVEELLEHLSWKKTEIIFTFQKLDRTIRTIEGKFIGWDKSGNLLVVENPDWDEDDEDQQIKSIRLQSLMNIEIPFLCVSLKVV